MVPLEANWLVELTLSAPIQVRTASLIQGEQLAKIRISTCVVVDSSLIDHKLRVTL